MLAISPCLDALRGCADQARKCASPYITSQLTIRKRRWTEGRIGAGIAIDTDLVLPKRFPIRNLRSNEIASSGGVYTNGDMVVEDISPAYTSHGGGGFTVEQLDPSGTLPTPNNDIEILYILDGDSDGVHSLVWLDSSSDPTSWSLVIRRTRYSP